jgi:hypothetical protein
MASHNYKIDSENTTAGSIRLVITLKRVIYIYYSPHSHEQLLEADEIISPRANLVTL